VDSYVIVIKFRLIIMKAIIEKRGSVIHIVEWAWLSSGQLIPSDIDFTPTNPFTHSLLTTSN